MTTNKTLLKYLKTSTQATGWMFLVFVFITGGLLLLAWLRNDHNLVYPLDDTYIHLAIAKQIAENGNWGLSEGRFAFSASGPVFTGFLAFLFALISKNTFWPLIINFIAGLGIIFLVDKIFKRSEVNPNFSFTGHFSFLLLTPLPLLVLCGMEHIWQVFIDILLVWQASILLTENHKKFSKSTIILFLLAALACVIRYEGIFLVGVIGFIFLIERKPLLGIMTWLSGAALVSLLGLYSMQNGGTFLPISVLGKGHSPLADLTQWFFQGGLRFLENPFMLVSLGALICLCLAFLKRKKKSLPFFFAFITAITMVGHVFAAEVGGYRYEAYLIGLSIISIILGIKDLEWEKVIFKIRFQLRPIFQAFVLMMIVSLGVRSGYFHYFYPRASQNIYHQQYQMALFLHTYYPDISFAANDIGAVTYFNDIQLTDLVGIGDHDAFSIIKANDWTKRAITDLTQEREVKLAIVHDIWVGEIIPDNWVKIGEWTIPDNFICADETVSFYCADEKLEQEITENFRAFSQSLPKGIGVDYGPF